MSCTPTQAAADEARRDVELAAELEGLSVEELTRKGATIYARSLLAMRDALPLMRPAPWRQFRIEDGGKEVSFRVRISTSVFSQAVFIERNIRLGNGGEYSEDACEIAEGYMRARLMNIQAKNKTDRNVINQSFIKWLEDNGELMKWLEEIDREVEHA